MAIGVSAEYLLQQSISRELIAIVFVELGFRLPAALLYLVQYATQVANTTKAQMAALVSAGLADLDAHGLLDSTPYARGETDGPHALPPDPTRELAEKEARQREVLLKRRAAAAIAAARKATEAAQQQQPAAAPPASDSPVDDAAEFLAATVASLERASTPSTSAPPPAPPARPFAPVARRPVAFDFDAEPTHVSTAAGTAKPSLFYIADFAQQQNLIIDLSDEDDEDGAEDAGLDEGGAAAEVELDQARLELDAKEREIKLMMDRIAAMEKNKRRKVSHATTAALTPAPVVPAEPAGDSTPSTVAATVVAEPGPIAPDQPPQPPAPSAALEEAKASLGQLVEERKEIIASQAAHAQADIVSATAAAADPVELVVTAVDTGGEDTVMLGDNDDDEPDPQADLLDVDMQLSASGRIPDVRP